MISTEQIRNMAPTAGIVLALGTLMSILGPYGTHALGVPWVWVYWTGLMALGWTGSRAFAALLARVYPGLPALPYALILATLVTVPVCAAVVTVEGFTGQPLPIEALPGAFFMVWVIAVAVTLVSVYMERSHAAARSAEEAGMARSLADKLPPRLRGAPVLALQAEDHYLRVHTEKGDCLVLMRLSDAIAAVEALDGARTHRSWWVARSAVTAIARGDGRATLTLSNGIEAPVSRTYAPRLREAGWY